MLAAGAVATATNVELGTAGVPIVDALLRGPSNPD
jgi:hypothetical protein